MLEARKNFLAERIFAIYNRNLLKRRFHSLQISGLNILRKKTPNVPTIIYANHSSWWDGLVAFQISFELKMDSFMIMEEKQLTKFNFFQKLGAFSIVREKPFEAVKSINYAVHLLKENPERTLWIFPQGEILHNDIQPIRFFKGISKIIEKVGECLVVPIAFRYEFLNEFKPEIFIKIGESIIFNEKKNSDVQIFEATITSLLDALKTDVLNKSFNRFEKLN